MYDKITGINNMKKIIVIGCPGSGKSTFSKELHKITGIPLFHLDMMYWNSDSTNVDKSVIFLDYPLDVCLNGIRERKGKIRTDIPWVETDEENIEFIEFVKNYNLQSKPKVMEVVEQIFL